MMNLPSFLFVFTLLYSASTVPINPHPDKIISLPGAPTQPEFNLFSGYLNGSSNASSVPIFYVLAEAIRVDPSTAPLLLWFNGGPGGSSLYGFFKEHGPYRVTESGNSLIYHEFSWNQYANVLYLESPLGVGFSQNSEEDLTGNDLDAAEINFRSLKDFMTRVHPNYADRDYYLSGQSYAGAFVPHLARRLLSGIAAGEFENKHFKGFAIGNPVFEEVTLRFAQIMQYHSYGLLPLNMSESVLGSWLKIEKGELLSDEDRSEMWKAIEIFHSFIGLNSPQHYSSIEHCFTENLLEDYHVPTDKKALSCFAGKSIESYLNRADVKTAIHVNSEFHAEWKAINELISSGYTRDDNVLPVYDDIFKAVNGTSFRVLIYNGDTDVMISPVHTIFNTRKIAETNEMKDLEHEPWTCYGDFAGVQRSYVHGHTTMDVLTVRGAGHSVPTDLPAQSFQMIHNFMFTEDNTAIDYSKPIRKH